MQRPAAPPTVASRSALTGMGLAVLSAATFGTSGAVAKSLLSAGWSPGAVVTVRIGVAAVVLLVPAAAAMRGRWGLLRGRATALLTYGLLAVAAAQVCYFNAVQHLSVGVALLLEYSGLILVVGWVWLRTGVRPPRLTLAGAAVAIAGLVLVLDLLGAVRLSWVGVLWGLGAAVGLASYFVMSARQDDNLPPLVLAAGGLVTATVGLVLVGAVGLLPMAASPADVQVAGRTVSWLVPALWLAVVAAVVAYLVGIMATRRLGATMASFMGLTEVLFAIVFAWLLLGELPRPVQLVGGARVLGGVALVRLDEARRPGRERMGAPQPVPVPCP